MKTLKVTELAAYEFEVPDDFPVTVERAEEFFCSLEHPRGDANQLTVLERYFDLEDADGNEIEMGIEEAVDIPVGRYGHTPSEPCSVNASQKVYVELASGLKIIEPQRKAEEFLRGRILDTPEDEIIERARALY